MSISQHHLFQWHKSANLCGISSSARKTVSATTTHILNDIHYIADVDCESTLLGLQQILTDGQAFCVHPPHYQPVDSQKPVDANGNTSNNSAVRKLKRNAPTDFVFECLTSGSNGHPKRIRRTHESWIASFQVNAQIAQITESDSYAIIGRLSHSLALYAALEAAYLGADILPVTELRPDKQLQAIAKHQSSILYATPTQLRLLCNNVKADDLASLQSTLRVRQIFCGGGKLDQRTASLVRHVFPSVNIREFYGATETSFISMSDEHTPPGSVGKPYPGVDLIIKDVHADSVGDVDGGNSVGEIWVKSPYLFHSYTDSIEKTAHWHDGYLSVGEIGHLDDKGYLYLAGRQSRRVNIADTLVYPEEIENVLNEHVAINHCAVIAIADEKRGSVLVAAVNAQPSDKLKQEVLVFLRQRVGSLKAPRDIIFLSHWPLLASGKPDLVVIEQRVHAEASNAHE